ncbi:Uncharacterised protein, partial [Mycoplasmopsis edwardii]
MEKNLLYDKVIKEIKEIYKANNLEIDINFDYDKAEIIAQLITSIDFLTKDNVW